MMVELERLVSQYFLMMYGGEFDIEIGNPNQKIRYETIKEIKSCIFLSVRLFF